MPATNKSGKPHPKVEKKASPSKAKAKALPVRPPVEAHTSSSEEEGRLAGRDSEEENDIDGSEEEEDTEGSDDDGVDEEGMERLMNALGDNGLDEFDEAQLEARAGSSHGESEEGDEEEGDVQMNGIVGEDGEVEIDDEKSVSDEEAPADGEGEDKDSEGEDVDEEEEAIALDDVESVDEDAVPRQKVVIDNKIALERIRESMQLDPSMPWTETLSMTYPESIDVDVDDDLNRELAFYKQALHGANTARELARKHNLPFTRPPDYFAEMVKSDAHMERIRQRLLDESAGIKRSEEKRKEREGKKFGKQVQLEKLKEREMGKKQMEERLKGLKRKRKDALDNSRGNNEEFDVAVEDAISDRPAKRGKGDKGNKMPRQARDKKFGFGGAGRRSKQNTKASTDNFDYDPRNRGASKGGKAGRGGGRGGFGRGGAKRLGKSRRVAQRSKT